MGVRRVVAAVAVLAGCNGAPSAPSGAALDASSDSSPTGRPGAGVPFYSGSLDAGAPGCPPGLSCFVDTCDGGASTTLTGTVYDPAGVTPLYNMLVYIPEDPQAPLPTLATGTTSCLDSCGVGAGARIGLYTVATVTDRFGHFTLHDAPTGNGIPLVMQGGKWRREVQVDIADCAETTAPAALTRLPRNQSEGDIPQMAIVTGACDELACLMVDLGLDPGEFTGPAGGGRLHVYKGAGPGPDLSGGGAGPAGDCSGDACPLWSSTQALSAYDVVLLGCECGEHQETKPAAAIQAMHDWLGAGGRVLATHYQDTWFKGGPADFQSVAVWLTPELDGPTPGPFAVPTTGALNLELQAWLSAEGVLDGGGPLPLPPADVSTSVTGADGGAVALVADETTGDPKVLSFSTPIGGVLPDAGQEAAPEYCGRAMFTDVHAGGGGVSSVAPVPASCGGGIATDEERALEYLFFDLSGPCSVESPPPPPCSCPE